MVLRRRRGRWGSLGLSLAVHATSFLALVLVVGTRSSDRRPEPAGSGLMIVELVGAQGIGDTTVSAAVSPPPVRRVPGPPLARPRPTEPPVAAEAPRPAQPSASGPNPADTPVDSGSGVSPAAAPEAGGSGSAVATERADGGVFASGPLSRVARPSSEIVPRYPDLARERGDEAEVIVEAWVAASGRVERARVRSSAGSEFDVAALEAIREARFHPAWRDGGPVDSVVAMRLHFELER